VTFQRDESIKELSRANVPWLLGQSAKTQLHPWKKSLQTRTQRLQSGIFFFVEARTNQISMAQSPIKKTNENI